MNSLSSHPGIRISALATGLTALALALLGESAQAQGRSAHVVNKYSSNLPPSAELQYEIHARKNGLPIAGQGQVSWQYGANRYSLNNSARATFFGKIQESSSQGGQDEYGLAPLTFTEKRYRKEMTTTSFGRDQKRINFSDSSQSYPLKGGEQDRASVVWQLVSVARANADKFVAGSEWAFFVAGRRDAENWVFKVIGKENVESKMGDLPSVHLSKVPPPDSQEQQVDLWLAPGMEWYPVQIRFRDADGDFVAQTIEKVLRK